MEDVNINYDEAFSPSLAALILRSEVLETMDVEATLQSQWTQQKRLEKKIYTEWGAGKGVKQWILLSTENHK